MVLGCKESGGVFSVKVRTSFFESYLKCERADVSCTQSSDAAAHNVLTEVRPSQRLREILWIDALNLSSSVSVCWVWRTTNGEERERESECRRGWWGSRGRGDVGEFPPCCVAVFYFNGILSSVRLFPLAASLSQDARDPRCLIVSPGLPRSPPRPRCLSFIVVAVVTVSHIFLGHHILF